jgi:A/G-specific adenine glycosylase
MIDTSWFERTRTDIQKRIHAGERPARLRRLLHSRIYAFYRDKGRTFPWRSHVSDYGVFVSEIMLQQTQTDRVVEKFPAFLERFPGFAALANACLADVLAAWQGLGYNRRAKYLRESAARIMTDFNGALPEKAEDLEKLPGIGRATARSILAFARNRPEVFCETNIRTVFLYFFGAPGMKKVDDTWIEGLVEATLDVRRPRQWYSALMDCGVYIKKHFGNLSVKSAGYRPQAPFEGSDRQIRGRVLRLLTARPHVSASVLYKELDCDHTRIDTVLSCLQKEGFVVCEPDRGYTIRRE